MALVWRSPCLSVTVCDSCIFQPIFPCFCVTDGENKFIFDNLFFQSFFWVIALLLIYISITLLTTAFYYIIVVNPYKSLTEIKNEYWIKLTELTHYWTLNCLNDPTPKNKCIWNLFYRISSLYVDLYLYGIVNVWTALKEKSVNLS